MHSNAKGRIQVVPDVFKLGNSKQKDIGLGRKDNFTRKIKNSALSWISLADKVHQYATDPRYWYSDYWHIGQTYNKKQSFTNIRVPINDMEMMMMMMSFICSCNKRATVTNKLCTCMEGMIYITLVNSYQHVWFTP
jgi:hypothetical protein